jgi:tetratricopeptide (TPR) repeat protein
LSRLEPPISGSVPRHDLDTPEFVQRGKVLVVQRQFQEAVKVCRLGLLGHPACVEGRLVLGMALMALGRHEEVVAEMRVALELDADNAMAHLLRGEALLGKADLQQAYDALLRAQDLDPLNEKVRRLLIEVEDRIDPEADEPDRPRTSTKVYPAPAARKLSAPQDMSGVSSVSVRAVVDDDAIISSVEEISQVELETAGVLSPQPFEEDDDEEETDVSDDWGADARADQRGEGGFASPHDSTGRDLVRHGLAEPGEGPYDEPYHRDPDHHHGPYDTHGDRAYDSDGYGDEAYGDEAGDEAYDEAHEAHEAHQAHQAREEQARDDEAHDDEAHDDQAHDDEAYDDEAYEDELPYEDEDESFTTAPWLPPQRFGKRRPRASVAGDTEVEEARVRSTDRRDLQARSTEEAMDLPIGSSETQESSVEISGLPFTTSEAGVSLEIDDPEEAESTEVNYEAPPPSMLFGDEDADDTIAPLSDDDGYDEQEQTQLPPARSTSEQEQVGDDDGPDVIGAAGSLRRGVTTEIDDAEAGAFGFDEDDDPTATQDVEAWDIGMPRRPSDSTAAVVLPEASAAAVDVLPESPGGAGYGGYGLSDDQPLEKSPTGTELLPEEEINGGDQPYAPEPYTPSPHTPVARSRTPGPATPAPAPETPPPQTPDPAQAAGSPQTLLLDEHQLEESESELSRPGTLILDSAHRREAARVSALVDGPASSDELVDLEPDIARLGRQTVDGFGESELSVPSSSGVEVLSEISVELQGPSADDAESDYLVSDPGTSELSLESLEILPEMLEPPRRPQMPPLPEESREVALPPEERASPGLSPNLPGLPPNLPALPPDAADDVVEAPFEPEEDDSEESDLETRVNFDAMSGGGQGEAIDAPSPFEAPPQPAHDYGPADPLPVDPPSSLGEAYDDGDLHDYPPAAADPAGYGAPGYGDGLGYQAPPFEAAPYDAPPAYDAPAPYEPPAFPDYGGADDVAFRPPSHLDDEPAAPPAPSDFVGHGRAADLVDRPPSHLDDSFDGLDAPSHLDDPRPQLEDRLGPYPGSPGHNDPVDFRPAVPMEPDSQEIELEAPRSARQPRGGPAPHGGDSLSPNRTAALDDDAGRVRPYVDSKQGTVETSPGGPRGLNAPSPANARAQLSDRRAVGREELPKELHQQLTGEARIAREARRAGNDRTSWVTLMLGDPGRQRWIRGAIAAGIVVLALAGGFLFRYLRIGHAVDRKRTDAASLLRRGNLGDYVLAAQKFDDIVRSQRDKTQAWLSRVCINAAIPFEFGDSDPRPIGNADVTGVDTAEKAAITLYRTLAKGDLDQAAITATALRARYPKDARVHYLAGRILLLQGSYEAAATRLESAIRLDPGHALYHRSLGDALAARGRAEKAEERYDKALKINANHVATHLSRARLLLDLRKFARAEALLSEIASGKYKRFAARGQIGWAFALQARLAASRGETDLVRRKVNKARSHAPTGDAPFYDTLADASIAAFSLGDAESFAKDSVKCMRGRPHPKLAKARIYLQQGRAQAALAALPARPQAEVSSVLRAQIMLRLGRVADARRYAKSALRGASDNVAANLVMAKVLAAEGKHLEAQDKLAALLEKRRDDSRVLTAMGEVLLARKRPKDAQRRFERAIRADKTALEAKLRLADVLLIRGKFRDAHRTLIEVHKRHSWYLPILRRLAELDLGKRNLTDARSNFERVLKLVPKDPGAQLGIVKVLTLDRKFTEARGLVGQIRGAMPGALELAEGRLALAQGEGKSAAGKLKVAKAALGKKAEVWLLLVRAAIFNDSTGKLQEASALVRQLERQLGKGHPAHWEARGQVAYGRGDLKGAAQSFKKAFESVDGALLMPIDRARLHTQLGKAQQDLGQVDEALSHYLKAKRLCPRCPEPLFNEGLALDEKKRKDDAIRALLHAKRLAPKMLQVYVELAKIYASAGKTRLAIKMYEKYVSLGPPNELKQQARGEIEALRMK